MKWIGLALLIPCLCFALLSACASTQEKYSQAVGKNSISDLENFLRENPKTPFTDEALKKLEALYFQRAVQRDSISEYKNFLRLQASGYFTPSRRTVKPPPDMNTNAYVISSNEAIARLQYEDAFKKAQKLDTPKSYETFLHTYPTGSHTDEVKSRLEKAHFETARRQGTAQAYQVYLSKYPKGEYVNAAREGIEKATWEKTLAGNTASGYNQFLKRYPQSRYYAEAQENLRKIEIANWQAAKSAETVEKYERFLATFPKSEFAAEAKARVETMDWERAKATGTPEAFYAFLKKHPEGKHAEIVREDLDRRMTELLAANVKKVSFSIHRNEEPFLGAMEFTANPFLTGFFGTKERPARMELKKPATVEMRRPPKGHAYVIMTIDVNITEDFPAEIKLVTAEGKLIVPHVKQVDPTVFRTDPGKPTWAETKSTVKRFKKGSSGVVAFMWTATEADLEKGTIIFGGRRYPLSKCHQDPN